MSRPLPGSLRDLLLTRYVPKTDEVEVENLETQRAGATVLQPQRSFQNDDVIEQNVEDVELVEEEYRAIHRIDETPKLVAKRPNIPRIRDEAAKVLRNILNTPANELCLERYDYFSQRWFHATRDSEKELVEYILLHPNHRPYFFSMQCRKLTIEDVSDLILKSLLTAPRDRGQCFARFAIQTTTEMTFETLYALLERIEAENDGITLTDGLVTATLTETYCGKKTTHRFKTENCKEYGILEPLLDEQGKLMASSAEITCSVTGKRHVRTQIMYRNNSSAKDQTARIRYIELEQTVKCMNRRVLIQEDRNELVEFEVDKNMIPLGEGIAGPEDLIAYLRAEGSFEEEN